MRRLLVGLALLLALGLAGPPAWFSIFPVETPPLPEPGRLVELDAGAAVNLVEQGEGPPVVLVHGLPGTAYHWSAVTEALADRGHRVLAYDRVGYGHSEPRADDDYTVHANAMELVALLGAEELDQATVVGWSYGGMTAMTAALLDPSRMGRLVLIGTAGLWEEAPPPSPVFDLLFSAPVQAWIVSVPPLFRSFQQGMGELFFSEQPVPAGFARTSTALFAQPGTRHTWRQEGRHFRFDGPDPSPIERPILLLHGDDDRIAPLVIAQGIASRAPDARLVSFPGGSHALPATHPGWVAGHIAAFAAEAGRGGGGPQPGATAASGSE